MTKVIRLIKNVLEIAEDNAWNKIAKKRDTKNAKFVSHKDAWS